MFMICSAGKARDFSTLLVNGGNSVGALLYDDGKFQANG